MYIHSLEWCSRIDNEHVIEMHTLERNGRERESEQTIRGRVYEMDRQRILPPCMNLRAQLGLHRTE